MCIIRRQAGRLFGQSCDALFAEPASCGYHQTHNQPIMDSLCQWLQAQIDEKRVEPNSALGEAICYMLKTLGTADRLSAQAGRSAGQQFLRTHAGESNPPSQKRHVFSDASWSSGR
jgi:hypothetical protein